MSEPKALTKEQLDWLHDTKYSSDSVQGSWKSCCFFHGISTEGLYATIEARDAEIADLKARLARGGGGAR